MTNGIISGAGTSRNFKVPANAKALYPTWDAALDAMIAGTFTFDLYGINPAGWDVIGDKLGKETLLTDALCTALGLPTTATPTQAMDKLRQLVATAQAGINSRCQIVSGSYAGTGTYGYNNPSALTFSFQPKIVLIPFYKNPDGRMILIGGSVASASTPIMVRSNLTTDFSDGCGFSSIHSYNNNQGKVSADGKTFSWYSEYNGSSGQQLNEASSTYYYVAIG